MSDIIDPKVPVTAEPKRPSGSTLLLYLLAGAGLLVSVLGWEAYAQGRCTFLEALAVSVLLGGLPLWISLLLILPDLLQIAFRALANRLRRQHR